MASGRVIYNLYRPFAADFVGLRMAAVLVLTVFLAGCSQLQRPEPRPFYSETKPPPRQEFRWSNGKIPKSLDPARAAAPPETDVVRAIFEGLTELNPQSLDEMPAGAKRWEASDDFRTWTFHLRDNARWSNGKPVTADDFVRSWRRLAELGDRTAHPELLRNIVGFPSTQSSGLGQFSIDSPSLNVNQAIQVPVKTPDTATSDSVDTIQRNPSNSNTGKGLSVLQLGVTAIDESTLRVSLVYPDRDFPKLVAHPVFRPVYDEGKGFEVSHAASIVTNGPFHPISIERGQLTVERSETYWNRESVKLERVTFVPAESAESALNAYKAGEIDAVTNAQFSPLVLKLLQPYEDFRRATHSAVNFYEINQNRAPFNDRRVREALAIAIERERLTEGELEGSTQPALQFLPFGKRTRVRIVQDKERAKELLSDAGFEDGENFPAVRLVVNRNDAQQRIARQVAAMWKRNLNIESEIIVKEAAELKQVRDSGDYDLVRRGVVLPTTDETANFIAIFGDSRASTPAGLVKTPSPPDAQSPKVGTSPVPASSPGASVNGLAAMLSEEAALLEFPAIPLYFPTTYSLVKPYVQGFDVNGLDSPMLSNVVIENNWQRK